MGALFPSLFQIQNVLSPRRFLWYELWKFDRAVKYPGVMMVVERSDFAIIFTEAKARPIKESRRSIFISEYYNAKQGIKLFMLAKCSYHYPSLDSY